MARADGEGGRTGGTGESGRAGGTGGSGTSRSAAPRCTVMSYGILGASQDDCAQTLKKKYRGELMKAHPDKGGKHEDFLEVQAAADKLASKRASFAEAIGRPVRERAMSAPLASEARQASENMELEGQFAIEA